MTLIVSWMGIDSRGPASDSISDDMLLELLDFVKNLEGKTKKERILSFSGIWKDMDDDFFDDLTKNLHKRRTNYK